MARPIKETPVLTGEHALKFVKAIKQNETKKVTSESYHRAQKAYTAISRKS